MLALGAALSIAAPIVRLVFAVLAGAAAVLLGWSSLQLFIARPVSAVSSTVTDKTGLAGGDALTDVIGAVTPTAWPALALAGWVLLLATAVLVLLTWRGWKAGGRRYRTDADIATGERGDGAVDAVESWDDLSRGTDPTR